MSERISAGGAVAGALVGGVLVGVYMVVWQVVGNASCPDTAVLGCVVEQLGLLGVAGLLVYFAWVVVLRLMSIPLAWVTPAAVGLVVAVLAGTTMSIDLPLAVWPLVAAVTSYLMAIRFGAGGRSGS